MASIIIVIIGCFSGVHVLQPWELVLVLEEQRAQRHALLWSHTLLHERAPHDLAAEK